MLSIFFTIYNVGYCAAILVHQPYKAYWLRDAPPV